MNLFDSITKIGEEDEMKCCLNIKAKGDYPLLKIVDIRNVNLSSSVLWKNFSVDEANEELQKKLTEEELNYISNANTSAKQEMKDKLKSFKLDFGKYVYRRIKGGMFVDIFITLKNEGGVRSEFYFKFPDDVAIKREIWMDPIEPTSNDKMEFQVLKEKIFEISFFSLDTSSSKEITLLTKFI